MSSTPPAPTRTADAEWLNPIAKSGRVVLVGGMVSMKDIRRYCDAIAAAFKPDKIILFGSYAYGQPTVDSDVDVLVVMPRKRYRRDLGWKIPLKVNPPFPVDILVRHDEDIRNRIKDGECFILDITEKGKVMYEAGHA